MEFFHWQFHHPTDVGWLMEADETTETSRNKDPCDRMT
jgi:hypothetical protein